MPFNTVKAKLTAANQTALDSLLASWAGDGDVAKQAATNLQVEHGGEDDNLEDYLNELAAAASRLSVPSPATEFDQVGRTFKLAGYEAAPFKGAILGRAMLLEKYARFFFKKLDELRCSDENVVRNARLRKLANVDEKSAEGLEMEKYFQALRNTLLGKGVVFATFAKPVKSGQRPWPAPIPDARGVRSSIALGEDEKGKDYILFAYKLPSGVVPSVPTTASPGWSYQKWFRPNVNAATDLHGWTEPLEPGFAPQPEIVHEEISGATVVFPIHIASA